MAFFLDVRPRLVVFWFLALLVVEALTSDTKQGAFVSVVGGRRTLSAPRMSASAREAASKKSVTLPPSRSSSPSSRPIKLHSVEINNRGEEGVPVVVLHGLLGSARNLRGWGSRLHDSLQRPRRIVIPDLRNHGLTGHTEGAMTYPELASDILKLLDDLSIERAILCGHSMGGKIASAAALANPDRIAGLVLMDIAPVPYTMTDGTGWSDTINVIEAISKLYLPDIRNKAQADGALADLGIDNSDIRAFALTNLVQDASTGQFRWVVNIDGIKRSLSTLANFEITNDKTASRYPHKTLMMHGSLSKYVRASHMEDISRLFETFSLVTVRGAGHWVHADDPVKTVEVVQSYLDVEVN